MLDQIEIMIEEMLQERVVTPLTRNNDVVRASVRARHFEFDSEVVREATVWNIIRKVAERGLSGCQSREKAGRALHVA